MIDRRTRRATTTSRLHRLALAVATAFVGAAIAGCAGPGSADPSQAGSAATGSTGALTPAAGPAYAPPLGDGSSNSSGTGSSSAAGTAAMPDPSWANVMAYGAVGDGTTDDSAAFRAAANSGMTVWVPRPAAFYKITGPILLKGSIIGDTSDLNNLPLVRMVGADGSGYHNALVVRGYHGAAQIVIAGLQIDLGYTSGQPSGGEWDHCITISDSDNVRVTNNRLLNAFGDGVQIGEWKRYTVGPSPELDCKNITVENNYIYNAFRCAVAPLFTSSGTVIRHNYLRKIMPTDGGYTMSVIDIEPDGGPQNSVVWNLLIDSNVVDARASNGTGIYFVFQVTANASAPDPIHGTQVTNNRGVWYAVSSSTLAVDTNNVYTDPPPAWTMQPLSM